MTGPPLSPIEIDGNDASVSPDRRRRRLIVGTFGLILALMCLGTAVAFVLSLGSASPAIRTPLPSGPSASASICNTFFGTPRAVAKEFGVASVTRSPITLFNHGHQYTAPVESQWGAATCLYRGPGPVTNGGGNDGLYLTVSVNQQVAIGPMGSFAQGAAASDVVFADAASADPHMRISQANRGWLNAAASKAELPGCRSRAPCSEP